MRNVSSDGNCLFSAMVDQLRIRGVYEYTPRSLRTAAVNFLRQNPQLVSFLFVWPDMFGLTRERWYLVVK
ncbi:hypothetical protein DPMN_076283 [Dreissena polymorpha]|uniref:OTU domain-containing protein n=1 Tax=Dreissena polymorpha TaxID=45954 RepID=A0A9D3YM29_DREPO|nr:hypothetical protein DPMN_076283 [Dreissena polymorpha]